VRAGLARDEAVELLQHYHRKVVRMVATIDKQMWKNMSHDFNAGHHQACCGFKVTPATPKETP